MSLLLEALKRAERQKKNMPPPDTGMLPVQSAAASLPVEPFPDLTMTLEPLPASEPPQPEGGVIQADQGAGMAPLEFSYPEAPLAAAPACATESAAEVEAPPCKPETTSPIPPPEPAQPQPAPTTGNGHIAQPDNLPPSPLATPEQRERVHALLGATDENPKLPRARRRQLVLGGMAATIALATAGTLFWLDRQMAAPTILQAQTGPMPLREPSPPALAGSTPTPPTAPSSSAEPQSSKNLLLSAAKPESPPHFPAAEKPARPAGEPPAHPREAGANPVAIRRSEQIITVHPATEAGYAAMANGNVSAAREHYQAALQSDQRSRDAQLGLAVAAMREGRSEEAARRYEQVLSLDPRDADANAGIALLRGATDPIAYEGRLRSLIEERGDNAALHHALGSLLARQHRWGEAQEAFFRAVTLTPRSADYQFNLAVSLDHLGHYTQARIYYRKALDLGASGSPTFNPEAAQTRIAAIDALKP